MTVSMVGMRGAAAALALVMLAGCSSEPDAAPVIVTPTSGAVSSPGSSMTSPVTDTAAPTTSPVPATTTSSSAPTAALTPEPTTTSEPGTETTSTRADDEPGPGTVVYRGTTYVMPPEETTKLAESLVITFDVADGVDVSGVDIKGAEKAYRGFADVADRAARDPDKNWAPELRKYLTEPLASDVAREIEGMVKRNVKSIGHSAFAARVVDAGDNSVKLRICNDISGIDRVDASDGHSVKAATGGRHPQDAELIKNENNVWKIRTLVGYPDQEC